MLIHKIKIKINNVYIIFKVISTKIVDKIMTALHQHLDNLIQKYHDNEYMSARLLNYMEHLLPSALEGELNTHLQREERKQNLSNNRDEFVSRFLHKNNYYFKS